MNKANIRLLGLCPKIKLNIRNLFDVYQWILIIPLVFFVSCLSLAQEVMVQTMPSAAKASLVKNKTEITPLKIGDKIPDEFWDMYFPVINGTNDQIQYINLGEFRDKVVVLDFWGTWCGTCISFMPHMQKLQKEFQDDLLIIPITYESASKIQAFLKNTKSPILRSVMSDFLSIVDGRYLWDSFEFNIVPHVVVIANDQIKGFAMPIHLDSESISALIEGKKFYIAKKRFKILEKPLLKFSFDDVKTQGPLYYSTLTGYTDGFINVAGHDIDSTEGLQHYYNTSLPIVKLYSVTGLFGGYAFDSKRRILEVNEPESYTSFKKVDGLYSSTDQAWKRENTYNYEIIAPLYLSEKAIKQRFKEDLDFYLGLDVRIEKRVIPVLILKETKKLKNTRSLSEKNVHALNAIPTMPLVVNEAKLEKGEILNISEMEMTLDSLNITFKEYGLELVEEEREMEMFVLTEQGYQKPDVKLQISRYGYIYPSKNQKL